MSYTIEYIVDCCGTTQTINYYNSFNECLIDIINLHIKTELDNNLYDFTTNDWKYNLIDTDKLNNFFDTNILIKYAINDKRIKTYVLFPTLGLKSMNINKYSCILYKDEIDSSLSPISLDFYNTEIQITEIDCLNKLHQYYVNNRNNPIKNSIITTVQSL